MVGIPGMYLSGVHHGGYVHLWVWERDHGGYVHPWVWERDHEAHSTPWVWEVRAMRRIVPSWVWWEGGIPLYTPPCLPVWYIRLPTMLPVCTQPSTVLTTRTVLLTVNSSVPVVKEARLCPPRGVPFHPENKPSPSQEPGDYDQQLRHRKHPCTRTSRIVRPLLNCSQTPLGVLARPFMPDKTVRDPPAWPHDS